jgi:hypothetical protein
MDSIRHMAAGVARAPFLVRASCVFIGALAAMPAALAGQSASSFLVSVTLQPAGADTGCSISTSPPGIACGTSEGIPLLPVASGVLPIPAPTYGTTFTSIVTSFAPVNYNLSPLPMAALGLWGPDRVRMQAVLIDYSYRTVSDGGREYVEISVNW